MAVAIITIGDLDDVKTLVGAWAADDDRSMEGEARAILRDAAGCKPRSPNLVGSIRARPT